MRVGVRELPSMVWTGTMVVSAEAGMRMFESGSFSAVVAGVDVTVTCGCSGCNWAWIDVVMMLISSEGSGGMLRVGNAMDVPGMVTTWGAWEVVLLVTVFCSFCPAVFPLKRPLCPLTLFRAWRCRDSCRYF